MHFPFLIHARAAFSLVLFQVAAVRRAVASWNLAPLPLERADTSYEALAPGIFAPDVVCREEADATNQNVTRVFLVGCERSGTTLLQSLLAAHSAIHSVPETHFVKRLFRNERRPRHNDARRNGPKKWLRGLHYFRRNMLADVGWVSGRNVDEAWREIETGHDEPLPFWRKNWARSQMRRFVGVMDRHCVRAGKRVWVEKTPEHLFYLGLIQRHVPGARFIHIVRDGKEVVTSLGRLAKVYPQWLPFADTDFAAARWNHAWRETRRWIGHPAHLIVRYETLLLAPRRTLARILQHLGCEPEYDLWKRYPHVARRLIRQDEPWKAGNLHSMRDCRKFAKSFDDAEQARIRAALDRPDWNALSRSPHVVADCAFVWD